ncbi:MAG: phosphoribosylglycinamide formyltransferase [Flavobacteriaceae bacterium]
MKRLIIFASGSGSNAENIIRYFQKSDSVTVVQVLTNNKNAKVINRCKILNIKCLVFNRDAIYKDAKLIKTLKDQADYIILAGFLWKIPQNFIEAFPNKILNVHPALLPKFGGKGMYGMHIHEAVIKNNETETGITIHYVNENYDEGAIIFQAKVSLDKTDTAKTVAKKIQTLEMEHFPKVIERVVLENILAPKK